MTTEAANHIRTSFANP